jgi:eukaryotic-like serine/threonine-protein kinase
VLRFRIILGVPMQTAGSSTRTLRFSVFEVDLRAAEVRKHGVRIKLQDQPFRILSCLLEHPGDLVTREELREELWHDHTFVDFDRSLNKAMAKLRSALGDSAESPRYIETVPRHGYRLLVSVAYGQDGEAQEQPAFGQFQTEKLPGKAEHFSATAETPEPGLEKPAQLFYSLTEGWSFSLLMAVIVTLVVLAGVVSLHVKQPPIFGSPVAAVNLRRSVAVLGFQNLSGDPGDSWLSTAFSDWLATELSAGEQLRTVPAENIARMKMELSLPDLDSLGPDSLSRIHKNLGTDLVVAGSYAMLGASANGAIRLDLRLLDARNGDVLFATSESGTQANLFDLVSRAGQSLRETLGIRNVTRAEAVEVASALPSNPEAARLYTEGLSKLRVFDALDAQSSLTRAVAAEPGYALSHSALASAWAQLGYDQNAIAEAKKAFELSGSLSRADRLQVEGQYRELSHDWEKALEIYQALFKFFPDNPDYGLGLAHAQIRASKWKDALDTIATLRALPAPLRDDPRIDLAEGDAARSLGDMKRAEAAMTRAGEKARTSGALLLLARARLNQAWLDENLGRVDEVNKAVNEARQLYLASHDRTGVSDAATIEAIALEIQGQYLPAQDKYEESLKILSDAGNEQGAANEHDNIADIQFYLGNLPGARKSYEEALATYQKMNDDDGVALAKIGLGDMHLVQGELGEAKRKYEESLAICRQIGDRDREADALQGLGQELRMEGDSEGAWRAESTAREIAKEVGDVTPEAEAQLHLAELLLDQGKSAEAAKRAHEAADLLGKAKAMRGEAMADLVFAKLDLAQGDLADAKQQVGGALRFAERSHDKQIGLSAQIMDARIQTISRSRSQTGEGITQLNNLAAQAKAGGYLLSFLEARLAIGKAELELPLREGGRTQLMEVRTEAAKQGVRLIAQKADAALHYQASHNK